MTSSSSSSGAENYALVGIVVDKRDGVVHIFNFWMESRSKKYKSIVKWRDLDDYDRRLFPGDWVKFYWNFVRDQVMGVRWQEERLVQSRVVRGNVQILTSVLLLDSVGGRPTRQLFSQSFGAIGLNPHFDTSDMRVGGEPKDAWIEWIAEQGERDRHLQKTGYDVLWKIARDSPIPSAESSPIIPANRLLNQNGPSAAADTSATLSTAAPAAVLNGSGDNTGTTSKIESSVDVKKETRYEQARKFGSFPRDKLNRIGIITGHKEGTPFYYVWTPGAPPMMEGQVLVRKTEQQLVEVCDWIRFAVSNGDENSIFRDGGEDHRFSVMAWERVEPYFRTRLSPNKLTIELSVSQMILSTENAFMGDENGGEIIVEDDDFGKIADRNGLLQKHWPIQDGMMIEICCVLRRVKPRSRTDSPWMILEMKMVWSGPDKTKLQQQAGGRDERSEEEEERRPDRRRDEQQPAPLPRYEHYLMQQPIIVDARPGDEITTTAFVEGFVNADAFVWVVDAASSGVVNGGAREGLRLGQCVRGRFRLQNNGKWGASMGRLQEAECPRDLEIRVHNEKVYVQIDVMYDKPRREYRNPVFNVVYDTDCKMPFGAEDKEIFTVEVSKIRQGFNVTRIIS